MCVHSQTRANFLKLGEFEDKCDYEKAGDAITCDPSDLKIIHLNIQGLNSKLFELNQLITDTFIPHLPDVVLLCETWLKQHSPPPIIPGYRIERNDRKTRKGGGVGVLISDRCKYKRRTDLETHDMDSFELCFIELNTGKSNILIGSVYQPPNTNGETFTEILRRTLQHPAKTRNLIIGLDHNLDLLKCDSHQPTQEFLEMLYDLKMTPTITKPTRITTSNATLIDNILMNIKCGIIEEHISDHLPCYNVIQGLRATKQPTMEITSRDIRPKNIMALKRRLESNPRLLLPQHGNSVDDQFDDFHKRLLEEINHFLPERTGKIHPKLIHREAWVSAGLLISIKKAKKLYRKHLKIIIIIIIIIYFFFCIHCTVFICNICVVIYHSKKKK